MVSYLRDVVGDVGDAMLLDDGLLGKVLDFTWFRAGKVFRFGEKCRKFVSFIDRLRVCVNSWKLSKQLDYN